MFKRLSTSEKKSFMSLLVILSAFTIFISVFTSSIGSYDISIQQTLHTIFFTHNTADSIENMIIWNMRLPRVLGALLVGACLGISGAAMQTIFRNPLADPSIIGVGTGSALAVILAIVFLPVDFINSYSMAIFAFIGALLTSYLVYYIGGLSGRSSTLFMILGGIAISIIAGTIMGVASYLVSDEQLRQISTWQMGSLIAVDWVTLQVALIFTVSGICVLLKMARSLDIFVLGEYECRDLGLNPDRIKTICIIAVALSVGAAIAVAGPIGFIGLIVPHIIRLCGITKNVYVMPLSAVGGAIFLLLCDTIARTVALPMDVPVGLVTGVPGGILFITLLLYKAKEKRYD